MFDMTGDRIGRQLSLATRRELIEAIAERYHAAGRSQKKHILDEFIKVTGYHRKHAIRALRPTKGKSRHCPVPVLEGEEAAGAVVGAGGWPPLLKVQR
jgi:hypothetical protein